MDRSWSERLSAWGRALADWGWRVWQRRPAWVVSTGGLIILIPVIVIFVLSIFWGIPPDRFDPQETARTFAAERNQIDVEDQLPAGYVTAATLERMLRYLLDKPGGYLYNDIAPPGVLMDNIPSFEKGVVIQCRDFAEALRDDMTRAQTQSREDPDLAMVDPQLHFNFNKWGLWLIPSTESEYRKAQSALRSYLKRLANQDTPADGQFYVRADNLSDWLKTVEKRLGAYAQSLAAAKAEARFQRNLAGEPAGTKAKPEPDQEVSHTAWLQIDNVWWEARGASYALYHFLRAVRHDFRPILEDKNALPSLNRIIEELDYALQAKYAPMVLNGDAFGLLANHSLALSSYMARASAGVIELRNLLQEG